MPMGFNPLLDVYQGDLSQEILLKFYDLASWLLQKFTYFQINNFLRKMCGGFITWHFTTAETGYL